MSCIAAVAVIALVIEAIQNTLSSRKVRVAKSGGLFDRPEACHPIEYDAKREAENYLPERGSAPAPRA
jgi:hypothetical protein